MPIMKNSLLLSVLAGFLACAIPHLQAAEGKPAAPTKSEKAKPGYIPFHGKIDSIDKAAKSIKVGERTFVVLPTTKINKAGKPATLEDAKTGDEVGGAYHETAAGKLELMSLRLGPKPEKYVKKDDKK